MFKSSRKLFDKQYLYETNPPLMMVLVDVTCDSNILLLSLFGLFKHINEHDVWAFVNRSVFCVPDRTTWAGLPAAVGGARGEKKRTHKVYIYETVYKSGWEYSHL